MKLQILRRLVQAATILTIGMVALLSLYAHYRAAGVIDDPQLMAGLRGEAATCGWERRFWMPIGAT